MNAVKYISVHRTFILNHIEVGSFKVIVDLTKSHLNIGQVREIMAAALHAMEDNDLSEIVIKVTAYNQIRDDLMKSYDCHRYGAGNPIYRLVNPKFENRSF